MRKKTPKVEISTEHDIVIKIKIPREVAKKIGIWQPIKSKPKVRRR